MANRKSMIQVAMEDLKNSSTPSLSPLRRRSSVVRRVATLDLEENDDEAERMTRRKEQLPSTRNDKRKSLGLSFVAQMSHPQIAERVSQCIKLSAENKINAKNAFSLEMIDFMTYMVKKQDANMSNLQMASTSLDVSTKIYGFRVDGVHTDILKMIGGLDKQEKNDARKQGNDDNGEPIVGESEDNVESQSRNKKKRKNKQKILTSVESLRGNVTTVNPASLMYEEADSQTTDLLYQAILPHHANGGPYLNKYNDVILDTVNASRDLNVDPTPMNCPKIENFANADMCQSFANFEFLGYSLEDEDETDNDGEDRDFGSNSQDASRSPLREAFQFDLDASLPPDDEAHADRHSDNFENVERCRGEIGGPANIVDFSKVVQASRHNKESEYSYFQDKIGLQWAGPSYWKIRFPTKNLGGSRIVEGCGQEALRRKKELLIAYNDEARDVCQPKFDIARSNLVKLQSKTARTWSEEKLTLPQDMHYDSTHYCRLYLKPEVLVKFPNRDRMNATHVSDEIGDYDYNNENDTTDYCPNIECGDDNPMDNQEPPSGIAPTQLDSNEEMGTFTQAFTGDNLVEAPKMNNKIFIPYSQRAKKIDMRQLKKCIWKDLTTVSNQDDENSKRDTKDRVVETKKFSAIYKSLPNSLSKANIEALSFPIAFISLLHLANEKTLKITSNEDYSELFVQQG